MNHALERLLPTFDRANEAGAELLHRPRRCGLHQRATLGG
jgi:hypothetical protein